MVSTYKFDGNPMMEHNSQLNNLSVALIDAINDREESVRESISTSLYTLGMNQPHAVLLSCKDYLKDHPKLPETHRVLILNTMEKIIREKVDNITEPLAQDLIHEAIEEMTRAKDVVPNWQAAASGVLVALGSKYITSTFQALMQRVQPGNLPHFFVMQTLADLAAVNAFGVVPSLVTLLGTLLPMLGMAKHDNLRYVFSHALGKFSEAILDYLANMEKAPDKGVTKMMFSSQMFSAFDVLYSVWLQSKEGKLRTAVMNAISYMAHLLAPQQLQEQIAKVVPGILALYKKHPDPLPVTQALCNTLDAATHDASLMLDAQFPNLIASIFAQTIAAGPDFSNPNSVKNFNELLRCFAMLARSFGDRLVAFLLQKLEGGNERTKIVTLTIMRHLVNSATEQMDNKQALLLSGAKNLVNDPSAKVRKNLAQVIIAMAHHSYLDLEGGQKLIEFIGDLSKLMVQDLADRVNLYVMTACGYFKSRLPEIRTNAAILVGRLLGYLPADTRSTISKDHVCSALVLLLKDNASDVRTVAAESISLLHQY